jgi:alkylation response protein AidB-like acyl-CoA dehydrogenase
MNAHPVAQPVTLDRSTAITAGRLLKTRSDALQQARSLVPQLRARAKQTEAERRIPNESIEALRSAGLFGIMVPKIFGGSQLGVAALVETVAEIASGCGSTGWVYGVMAGHAWMLSLFPPEAQREVFPDADALIASVVRLGGHPPRRVAGGYLFEGAAGRFCSGIDHAAWVMVGAAVDSGDGSPQSRYFMLPKSEIEIVDDWRAVGLCGTGSHSLRIERALVPDYRSCAIAEMTAGTAPGILFHDASSYRAPFPQVLPFPLAGVPIGLARAALELFVENFRAKLKSMSDEQAGEQGAIFTRISEVDADVEAAAVLVTNDAMAIDEMANGTAASPLQRARYVRNIAYAGNKCRLAVTNLFEASGGSAVYDAFALQRVWRDINAAVAHNSFMRDRSNPTFARAMLGLPPSKFDRIGH